MWRHSSIADSKSGQLSSGASGVALRLDVPACVEQVVRGRHHWLPPLHPYNRAPACDN